MTSGTDRHPVRLVPELHELHLPSAICALCPLLGLVHGNDLVLRGHFFNNIHCTALVHVDPRLTSPCLGTLEVRHYFARKQFQRSERVLPVCVIEQLNKEAAEATALN